MSAVRLRMDVALPPGQMRLDGTGPALDPELGQFFTPQQTANKIAGWAIERWRDDFGGYPSVLEPNCGAGNLAAACLDAGAAHVAAIEIDGAWAKVAAGRLGPRAKVIHGDFLSLPEIPQAGLAVMNPPWDGGAHSAHIARALTVCDRVVALCPTNVLFGATNHALLWRKAKLTGLVCFTSRPKFVGQGGQLDVVLVEITNNGLNDGPSVEWWR